MDVFLKQDVVITTRDAIVSNSLAGLLLLLPEKTIINDVGIQSVILSKEQHVIGKYVIVVF
jgi:hypothetical protein